MGDISGQGVDPLRVLAAAEGRLPMSALTEAEQAALNERLDAALASKVSEANWAPVFAAAGQTIVALDDAGQLVEYRPDGTSTVIGPV